MGHDATLHLELRLKSLRPTEQVSSLLWLPRETRAWLLPSCPLREVIYFADEDLTLRLIKEETELVDGDFIHCVFDYAGNRPKLARECYNRCLDDPFLMPYAAAWIVSTSSPRILLFAKALTPPQRTHLIEMMSATGPAMKALVVEVAALDPGVMEGVIKRLTHKQVAQSVNGLKSRST